jgi:hypothetical protein
MMPVCIAVETAALKRLFVVPRGHSERLSSRSSPCLALLAPNALNSTHMICRGRGETTPRHQVNTLATDEDRALQIDYNDTMQPRTVDRLRTSLIVDPADGSLPPVVPAARERRVPARSTDDPET